MKKKVIAFSLAFVVFLCSFCMTASAADKDTVIETKAKSAVLMCTDTGDVIYENNAHERLHPASVTKIMSLLLIVESIESGKLSLDENVTVSTQASQKGGSQIWLKENEQMSVRDLLKATAVASANDACAALAEKIAGSETAFVKMMNNRAKELGMKDTNFENCTGLDDTAENHLTSAYDIAIMSRELIRHEMIKEYTTIWMDSLRGGQTELTNTNKLIRFYDGATGLKTGTTAKAGSCLSATATRDGLSFVAVVMGCATSNDRFDGAKALLNYGFANYALYNPKVDEKSIANVNVAGGVKNTVKPLAENINPVLIKKGDEEKIKYSVNLPEQVSAPVEKGQVLGEVVLTKDGKQIGKISLKSPEKIEQNSFWKEFKQMLMLFVK